MPIAVQTRADPPPRFNWPLAAGTYAALLLAFWFVAQRYDMPGRLGGHFPSAFVSFALLLAPYWAFGFGAADALLRRLRSPAARVLLPGLLVIPYLVFAVPRGELRAVYVIVLLAIPVGLAALMELLPPPTSALS